MASATEPRSVEEPQNQPQKNNNGLLILIPDSIDVEEEARLYDELCDTPLSPPEHRPPSPTGAPSVFSNDIWLGDNSGESKAFARDVKIVGWTNVGDKLGGAYVVFDCAIHTKEGTVIHVHKRYSAFAELHARLRTLLPRSKQRFLPSMPPKSPLSKFRPSFLEQRRQQLEHWLQSILLHPDLGGSQIVRDWVME
ncbi:Phox-like protein [Panus rudis PR-1116 ss-1]|nr:Phox-like protein [Panus rudis PR-1116 ss-1]